MLSSFSDEAGKSPERLSNQVKVSQVVEVLCDSRALGAVSIGVFPLPCAACYFYKFQLDVYLTDGFWFPQGPLVYQTD